MAALTKVTSHMENDRQNIQSKQMMKDLSQEKKIDSHSCDAVMHMNKASTEKEHQLKQGEQSFPTLISKHVELVEERQKEDEDILSKIQEVMQSYEKGKTKFLVEMQEVRQEVKKILKEMQPRLMEQEHSQKHVANTKENVGEVTDCAQQGIKV